MAGKIVGKRGELLLTRFFAGGAWWKCIATNDKYDEWLNESERKVYRFTRQQLAGKECKSK